MQSAKNIMQTDRQTEKQAFRQSERQIDRKNRAVRTGQADPAAAGPII